MVKFLVAKVVLLRECYFVGVAEVEGCAFIGRCCGGDFYLHDLVINSRCDVGLKMR